jgi:hypothetical protein
MHHNPAPMSKKRNHQYLIPIAAVLVLGSVSLAAVLGVFGTTTSDPRTTFQLTGSITIIDSSNGEYGDLSIADEGDSCEGTGAYSDLSSGTAVIVANPQGQTVATGTLQAGQSNSTTSSGPADRCTMSFTVPNVPLGLSSYTVTISHRGSQVVSAAEAASGVELTIGS